MPKLDYDPYTVLARAGLMSFITSGTHMDPPCGTPSKLLETRAGVFVSIHKHGELRGCMGTIQPAYSSVAKEIIENAIAASSRDPRFPPIEVKELSSIDISIDVLGSLEPAEKRDLDPDRFGVVVSEGERCGVLLPRLDGVDTVEDQLAIAARKAGISDTAYHIQKFEVRRYSELDDKPVRS
ncbi:MAG: AmmeMemoRadiSam system protein A [Eggerthellaceae bacterium]|jgi:AmmeMemoRadiSam system protein A|nr:AmmeMemoRadiSam system protein A [Eggerthellaceae bacterium]MCH4221169.1 AmmeMemoRadiSam system protein A [Eggerthellaceae bacterium]